MTAKRKRALKKKSVTWVEEQARWEIFFEQGSWVNKGDPQVKKKSVEGRAEKKKCDSTSVTAPGLVIG